VGKPGFGGETGVLVGKPGFFGAKVKERSHFEDLNLDGREITNWSLRNRLGSARIGLIRNRRDINGWQLWKSFKLDAENSLTR
jgi:hypothetical protein